MLRTLLLGLFVLAATVNYGTPRNAMINGEKWNIVEYTMIWHEGGSWKGWTDCWHRSIAIARFMPRNVKSVVIVHEIEHAMTCEDGQVHNEKFNNPPNGIHTGIYWSADQWRRFIIANPELIQWIGESDKD